MSGSCAPTPSAGWLQIATTSSATKRKHRPAGTPDPDAEVVSLSPLTLLESKAYVCEVCNRGFRRASNLQMHRRRYGVPREQLRKRGGGTAAPPARKRVFVCPEPSCLHHPSRALSSYSAIKQHFRRKHDPHRRWACSRCSRSYAVRSDYKLHLKTCRTGVRYPCHCGRVFCRVDTFVHHQQSCGAGLAQAGVGAGESSAAPVCGVAAAASQQPAMALSRSGCASPSSDIVVPTFRRFFVDQVPPPSHTSVVGHNVELQLMPSSSCHAAPHSPPAPISRGDDAAIQLQLSMGPCSGDDRGGEGFRPSSLHLPAPRGRARWRRACLGQGEAGGTAAGDGSGGRAGEAAGRAGAGGAAAACGGVSALQRAMLGFPSWTAA